MSKRKRRPLSAEFKARITTEALQELKAREKKFLPVKLTIAD